MKIILKCLFSGQCTREEAGKGCGTCPDYYPREGQLIGEEVYCYQCRFDYANAGTCFNCHNMNEFSPTPEHRKHVREEVAFRQSLE